MKIILGIVFKRSVLWSVKFFTTLSKSDSERQKTATVYSITDGRRPTLINADG